MIYFSVRSLYLSDGVIVHIKQLIPIGYCSAILQHVKHLALSVAALSETIH